MHAHLPTHCKYALLPGQNRYGKQIGVARPGMISLATTAPISITSIPFETRLLPRQATCAK